MSRECIGRAISRPSSVWLWFSLRLDLMHRAWKFLAEWLSKSRYWWPSGRVLVLSPLCAPAPTAWHKGTIDCQRLNGKLNSGRGVLRSLPAAAEYSRNSSVISAQTVCVPRHWVPYCNDHLDRNRSMGLTTQLNGFTKNILLRLGYAFRFHGYSFPRGHTNP